MSAKERLLYAGYEGVKYLTNYSYDYALIGVTVDGRAVYNYELMVEWLMNEEDCTYNEAVEWIDVNTLKSLPYMGSDAPIIMYRID
jgi:hypothetical protein